MTRGNYLYEDLTPAQFAAEIAAGRSWQLVDVREPWELAIASVGQCIHIPMAEIPSRQAELDKTAPVAVLCHSGGRSSRVAAYLCEQGFVRVANIAGGIDAWALEVDSSVARY